MIREPKILRSARNLPVVAVQRFQDDLPLRIGFAILLYFLYTNLLSAAKVWVARGELPSQLGLWWVHGLLVALAILVIFRNGILRAARRMLAARA